MLILNADPASGYRWEELCRAQPCLKGLRHCVCHHKLNWIHISKVFGNSMCDIAGWTGLFVLISSLVSDNHKDPTIPKLKSTICFKRLVQLSTCSKTKPSIIQILVTNSHIVYDFHILYTQLRFGVVRVGAWLKIHNHWLGFLCHFSSKSIYFSAWILLQI